MATVFSISDPARIGTGNDPAWIKHLVTGSIFALVLIGGVPTFHHLLRKKPKPALRLHRPDANALDSLRASILGRGKQHIASMLGLPKAMGNEGAATWYYALDNADRLAMAIQFDQDQARAVEFFKSPV